MGSEVVTPTWRTWYDFDLAYDAWKKNYDASPTSAGQFFHGGEILPDGSTILESETFEVIQIDFDNDTSTVTVKDVTIPRTRADMKKLYEFDPTTDKRKDIVGDHPKKTEFYKQFITDMEEALVRDEDDTLWLNFNKTIKSIKKSDYL